MLVSFVICLKLFYIINIMGCNCKNIANKAQKYTDEETTLELRGVEKSSEWITKFFVAISLIIIIIISIPIITIYAIYCVLTGSSINISKILKRNNGKDK